MTPKQKNEFLVVEFFFRISEHLCPSEVKNSTFTKKIKCKYRIFLSSKSSSKIKMIFKKSKAIIVQFPKFPPENFKNFSLWKVAKNIISLDLTSKNPKCRKRNNFSWISRHSTTLIIILLMMHYSSYVLYDMKKKKKGKK